MARLVIFTQNTALVISNPYNEAELLKYPNVIREPDLSSVHNVHPDYWKQQKGEVVAMDPIEQNNRLKEITERGRITEIEPIYVAKSTVRKASKFTFYVIGAAIIALYLFFLAKK